MHIAAIIAEYDPFHQGHLYLVNKARQAGADYIIVIMSGNFVQRGGPAAFPIDLRTRMALNCGVDMVLEIPSYACCQSAEVFAQASVSILNHLAVVDDLFFGCEDNDAALLDRIADILTVEPALFKEKLNSSLREGNSFPAARSQALFAVMPDPAACQILSRPNNILAIEYMKALKKTGSRIRPVPVRRIGDPYHAETVSSDGPASATAIRSMLTRIQQDEILHIQSLPEPSRRLIADYLRSGGMVSRKDFSDIAMYAIFSRLHALEDYCDISKTLANRFRSLLPSYSNIEDFASQTASKNIAASAIWRSIFNIVLDHRKDIFSQWKEEEYLGYVNVLGLNKRFMPVLGSVSEEGRKMMIIRPRDLDRLNETGTLIAKADQYADRLYRQICTMRFGMRSMEPYLKTVII